MRVAIVVEYDGLPYCGWQGQKNGISVQQVLTEAMEKVLHEKVTLHASGRTDRGVHALGQVVHFDTNTCISVEKLPAAFNTYLPNSIAVKSAKEVSPSFHARFAAKQKTYVYKIYNSKIRSPIKQNTHCHIKNSLDFEKMQEAAELLVGTMDYKCFMASGSFVQNTVRTIYSLTVAKEGDEITLTVTGNGFLYNMVRIIAGTLIYVGCSKITLEGLKRALETGDRKLAGKTLPPHGLYLHSAEYSLD
jgi:tRNA pseudouridine38-40 synthase